MSASEEQGRFPPGDVENTYPPGVTRASDAVRERTAPITPVETVVIGDLEQRKLFVAAFCKAQLEYEPIERDTHVDMKKEGKLLYSFDYSSQDELIKKTRKALAGNGILFRQPVSAKGGQITVTTILEHVGGYREETAWTFKEAGDKKAAAGDITYIRRYMTGPALSLAGEMDADDEGQETQAPDWLIQDSWNAADQGTAVYRDWYMTIDPAARRSLRSRDADLKKRCDEVDLEIKNGGRK